MSSCHTRDLPNYNSLKRAKNGQILPLDFLVYINTRTDWFSRLKRWAVGPYEHVAIYLGEAWGMPLKYESEGRGVSIKSLLTDTNLPVVVVRTQLTQEQADKVFVTIMDICSNPESYYDYAAVVKYCLPRILKEKFHIELPVYYKRDAYMICSEAAAEPFWRNIIPILKMDDVKAVMARSEIKKLEKQWQSAFELDIPMPSDFVNSDKLQHITSGKLFVDVFPWEEK